MAVERAGNCMVVPTEVFFGGGRCGGGGKPSGGTVYVRLAWSEASTRVCDGACVLLHGAGGRVASSNFVSCVHTHTRLLGWPGGGERVSKIDCTCEEINVHSFFGLREISICVFGTQH